MNTAMLSTVRSGLRPAAWALSAGVRPRRALMTSSIRAQEEGLAKKEETGRGVPQRGEGRLRRNLMTPFLSVWESCDLPFVPLLYYIAVAIAVAIGVPDPAAAGGSPEMMPGVGRVGSLLRTIEDEMSDMLNRVGMGSALAPSEVFERDIAIPFAVDVRETDKEITIVADTPGLSKEDVKVSVSPDKMITIRGERKIDREEEEANFRRVERQYGAFVRRFKLPDNVDPDHVDARLENGELFVTVPKTERAQEAHETVVEIK